MCIKFHDLLFCLIVVFLIFFCISSSSTLKSLRVKKNCSEKKIFSKRAIEINVQGAVCSPGVYIISPGTSVKEVLALARLSDVADKPKLNLKAKLLSPCALEVPEKINNK